MSAELQALLSRTQRPQETQTWTEPSREPSPYLNALLGRMEAREWQQDTLERLVLYLQECAYEIKLILHLRKCKQCQLEASLSIERYGGRCLPWFLDLINDPFECGADIEELPPHYKNRPRVQDYKIGSYWDKSTDHNETWKFINDRINWAEKIIRRNIWQAVDFYKRLKNWNLDTAPPTSDLSDFYA